MTKTPYRILIACLVILVAAAASIVVVWQPTSLPTATQTARPEATATTVISATPTAVPSITPTVLPTGTAFPSPTPTASCLAQGGTTNQVKFASEEMGETFTFTVYFPPCYDPGRAGGYPVIYLLHGQNMDDTLWPSLGVTRAADEVIQSGKPAFLMVFPYEVHNFTLPSESKFGEAVMEDLIPYIESHYDVCTLRQCREIGGISRGGGWAIHLGLTHLDMFSAIGAHSPGWFSGDLYRVQNLLTTHSVADFPRIYIDRGDKDYLANSIDLYEKNLTATGVAHEYHVNPGSHAIGYWKSQMQNYINWYVQGFTGLN